MQKIYTPYFGMTEEEIILEIRCIHGDQVLDIMDHYGFKWNDNESESRNEQLFAEFMISLEPTDND